jgi:hypothetical protein
MVYTVEEGQLLRLWSVIRCFEVIQETQDPVAQSEILTAGSYAAPNFAS